ncbi:MAG: ABC transporter permease [Clostridiales bacterium]|nr:ABC transporter permease [Clostridiales bacterium]
MKTRRRLSSAVLTVVDILQTIPTLALFTFLMLVFGLNDTTVVASIFLYSLFPIVRNTYTGIAAIDKGVVKAGRGIGMTSWQIYYKLEIPIAMPVIISGIRLAVITALGVATTGVLIGAGGLGLMVWRGIQTRNTVLMLSGAVPVSLLAILFDVLLSALEKRQKRQIR